MKKIEIATVQIETAIDLYYLENYASAITLAGAAEELLGSILNHNSELTILAELVPWYKDEYKTEISFKDLSSGMNEVRNELKHSHTYPDLNYEVEVTEPHAMQMLQRSIVNYMRACQGYTEKMYAFKEYYLKHANHIFSEWAAEKPE
jgi:hypothetical protein